jgi:excisionase family DNA binding protein
MDTKLMSVTALANLVGCSPTTIFRLVRSLKIPHRRIGRMIRFAGADVEDYLKSIKIENGGNNEK